MQRWEFFLTADREYDLSGAERAAKWAAVWNFPLRGTPGKVVPEAVLTGVNSVLWSWACGGLWTHPVMSEDYEPWSRAVQALRSVSARTQGFRGRKAKIQPVEADAIASGYISMLVPQVVIAGRPLRGTIRLRHLADPRKSPTIETPAGPTLLDRHIHSFATAASLFWQTIFASLIQPDGVCADCGRDLVGARAKRCGTCKAKRYWQSLPIEERRRKAADKKRRQRERERQAKRKGTA